LRRLFPVSRIWTSIESGGPHELRSFAWRSVSRRSKSETFRFHTPEEVQKHRDGAYVGDASSKAEPGQPLSYRDLIWTGRLFGLIAVRDRYDRAETQSTGRVWQRAHLLATARADKSTIAAKV